MSFNGISFSRGVSPTGRRQRSVQDIALQCQGELNPLLDPHWI